MGWLGGAPRLTPLGEKHLEVIPPLPASASGCRDVFSRVVSSWVLYTALPSTSCFRENTLALFYSVLYSNVHKFLQLAITVDFIPLPCGPGSYYIRVRTKLHGNLEFRQRCLSYWQTAYTEEQLGQ